MGGREEGRERERERETERERARACVRACVRARERYLGADNIAPDGREIVPDFEPEVLKHVAHGAALKRER